MKLRSFLCIAGLVVGAAACDRGADFEAEENGVAMNEPAGTTGFDDTAGTAGQTADNRAQADRQQDQGFATRGADLPDTASPLPLAGLIGLLSLGGAAGLRLLTRR